MSPVAVAKYVFDAAILVLSFFFAFRLLFAHDMRRHAWRSVVKRRVYISQPNFKRLTILFGWIFLFIAIFLTYRQIDRLVS